MTDTSTEHQLRQLRTELHRYQNKTEGSLEELKATLTELIEAVTGTTKTDKDSIRTRLGAVERNTLSIQQDVSAMSREVQAIAESRVKVRGELEELKWNQARTKERMDERNGTQDEKLEAHRKWLVGITFAVVVLSTLACVALVVVAVAIGWI